MTGELETLRDWLRQAGGTRDGMESAGSTGAVYVVVERAFRADHRQRPTVLIAKIGVDMSVFLARFSLASALRSR